MEGLFIFILGLAIGSFLNVLIFRLPENKSILGFSRCRNCKERISWHDNIPVLSFLFLKGRCRSCKTKISWQYSLIELLTAFLFLFSFLTYRGNPLFLIYTLFLIGLFIVIAVIDLKHLIILDSLVLAGFIVSLSYFMLSAFYFVDSLYGLLFFAGMFLFIFLMSKGKWIGFGDVKLAAMLGFIFGLESSVSIFYLTFSVGFIYAIMLLTLKKADLKTEVPLGSLMSIVSIFFLLTGFDLFELINAELILRLWIN